MTRKPTLNLFEESICDHCLAILLPHCLSLASWLAGLLVTSDTQLGVSCEGELSWLLAHSS